MAGVTDTQSIRFGQDTDVIDHTLLKNLADDVAVQLDAADVARTAALKRPAVFLQRLAVLALPAAASTVVPYDTLNYDTHGMVNLGGQPTRVTVSASSGAGIYMVHAVPISWDKTGWTRADVIVSKNGTPYMQRTLWGPQSTMAVQGMVFLGTVGDYIETLIYHESGGTTNLSVMNLYVWKVAT